MLISHFRLVRFLFFVPVSLWAAWIFVSVILVLLYIHSQFDYRAAAMPELFHDCERKNKLDKRIVRFVIPFCVTLNSDGSAVYIATAAMFVGGMYGGVLTTGNIVLVG